MLILILNWLKTSKKSIRKLSLGIICKSFDSELTVSRYLKSFNFNTHEHSSRRNTAKKLFNLGFIEDFAVLGFLSLRLNFKGRMEIHKYRNLPLKCVTRVRRKVRMVQTNALPVLPAFYRKCFLKNRSFNSRSRKFCECFCFLLLEIRLIRHCSQWRLIENFEYKANNELTECHGSSQQFWIERKCLMAWTFLFGIPFTNTATIREAALF